MRASTLKMKFVKEKLTLKGTNDSQKYWLKNLETWKYCQEVFIGLMKPMIVIVANRKKIKVLPIVSPCLTMTTTSLLRLRLVNK